MPSNQVYLCYDSIVQKNHGLRYTTRFVTKIWEAFLHWYHHAMNKRIVLQVDHLFCDYSSFTPQCHHATNQQFAFYKTTCFVIKKSFTCSYKTKFIKIKDFQTLSLFTNWKVHCLFKIKFSSFVDYLWQINFISPLVLIYMRLFMNTMFFHNHILATGILQS